MCLPITPEEMEENAKNPDYCVICCCNRDDILVEDHVCEECQEDTYAQTERT